MWPRRRALRGYGHAPVTSIRQATSRSSSRRAHGRPVAAVKCIGDELGHATAPLPSGGLVTVVPPCSFPDRRPPLPGGRRRPAGRVDRPPPVTPSALRARERTHARRWRAIGLLERLPHHAGYPVHRDERRLGPPRRQLRLATDAREGRLENADARLQGITLETEICDVVIEPRRVVAGRYGHEMDHPSSSRHPSPRKGAPVHVAGRPRSDVIPRRSVTRNAIRPVAGRKSQRHRFAGRRVNHCLPWSFPHLFQGLSRALGNGFLREYPPSCVAAVRCQCVNGSSGAGARG